jgi:hypothetical protein
MKDKRQISHYYWNYLDMLVERDYRTLERYTLHMWTRADLLEAR